MFYFIIKENVCWKKPIFLTVSLFTFLYIFVNRREEKQGTRCVYNITYISHFLSLIISYELQNNVLSPYVKPINERRLIINLIETVCFFNRRIKQNVFHHIERHIIFLVSYLWHLIGFITIDFYFLDKSSLNLCYDCLIDINGDTLFYEENEIKTTQNEYIQSSEKSELTKW